jgi:hypothetical protein
MCGHSESKGFEEIYYHQKTLSLSSVVAEENTKIFAQGWLEAFVSTGSASSLLVIRRCTP